MRRGIGLSSPRSALPDPDLTSARLNPSSLPSVRPKAAALVLPPSAQAAEQRARDGTATGRSDGIISPFPEYPAARAHPRTGGVMHLPGSPEPVGRRRMTPVWPPAASLLVLGPSDPSEGGRVSEVSCQRVVSRASLWLVGRPRVRGIPSAAWDRGGGVSFRTGASLGGSRRFLPASARVVVAGIHPGATERPCSRGRPHPAAQPSPSTSSRTW